MSTPSIQTPVYDLAFFRRLFEGTTDDQWCTIMRTKRDILDNVLHCALGWCDAIDDPRLASGSYGPVARTLGVLFQPLAGEDDGMDGILTVGRINDGEDPRYQQPTPRARILAAISDLERMAATP